MSTYPELRLLEVVQKHIQVRDDLLEVAPLFAKALLVSKPGRALFRTLMYYINEVGEVSDQQKFIEEITQVGQNYREDAMTIAQQLRQEGLQQGLQQGGHDKAFEIAKSLLSSGVDQQIIKSSTGLSDEDITRLRLH